MSRVLNESFIPILLVFSAIFIAVFYSNYVADIDAEQITVIEVPSINSIQGDEENYVIEEESFSQVEKLRKNDPVYTEAYEKIKNKNWKEAKKEYLKLIDSNDTSQARTELGYVLYKKNEFYEAEKHLIKALRNNPVYVPAYFYLAKTLRKLGEIEEAEENYNVYLKHFPIHFSAQFNLGMLQLKQNKNLHAIETFKKASGLAPGRSKSKAMYFLGKSYQKLGVGYYEKAKQAYQISVRVSPGNIKPRMGMASLLPDSDEGNAEAEEIYHQVIKLKENHSPAYFMLASIYKIQGKEREAITSYEKAIEYNPANVPARYNYGLLLLSKKKWSEASDQFHAIVNINPGHEKAYFNLGRANFKLKFYDQALEYYQAALKLKNGDYPEVLLNIGLIYSAKKEYTKAIDIYKKSIEKNSESAKTH